MDAHSKNVEIDYYKLRNDSLKWVESMRLKNSPYGRYKFCSNGHVTIMSSCFALFIRELLNDLENTSDEDRQEWIDYLKSSQDQSTGLFYDPEYNKSDLKGKHDEEYFLHQNTMFCLSALNALNSKPNYQLSFLEKYNLSNSNITLKERAYQFKVNTNFDNLNEYKKKELFIMNPLEISGKNATIPRLKSGNEIGTEPCKDKMINDLAIENSIVSVELLGCTCLWEIPFAACACYVAIIARHYVKLNEIEEDYQECLSNK